MRLFILSDIHNICHCMYCCYLSYFIRFLFFTVCLLCVLVRMNVYVMFLLRQRRLNKLIMIIISLKQTRVVCLSYTQWWRRLVAHVYIVAVATVPRHVAPANSPSHYKLTRCLLNVIPFPPEICLLRTSVIRCLTTEPFFIKLSLIALCCCIYNVIINSPFLRYK